MTESAPTHVRATFYLPTQVLAALEERANQGRAMLSWTVTDILAKELGLPAQPRPPWGRPRKTTPKPQKTVSAHGAQTVGVAS